MMRQDLQCLRAFSVTVIRAEVPYHSTLVDQENEFDNLYDHVVRT